MYVTVKLWRFRATTFLMETFVFFSYVCGCQKRNYWKLCHGNTRATSLRYYCHFYVTRNSETYSDLHVMSDTFFLFEQSSYFLDIFFVEFAFIKFHGNSSVGSRIDTCGQMERCTDVMKLRGACPGLTQTRLNCWKFCLYFLFIYLLCTIYRMAANTALNSIKGLVYIMEIQRVLC
jgi:hypothetical protein